MNAQKYTQKSLAAIQAAQELTIENNHQQIEQVHLLSALLRQESNKPLALEDFQKLCDKIKEENLL